MRFLIWQIDDFAENRQIKNPLTLFPALSLYAEALTITKFKIHQCILITVSPNLMLAKVSRYTVLIQVVVERFVILLKFRSFSHFSSSELMFAKLSLLIAEAESVCWWNSFAARLQCHTLCYVVAFIALACKLRQQIPYFLEILPRRDFMSRPCSV